jgi:hemolysin activation/secretion protein
VPASSEANIAARLHQTGLLTLLLTLPVWGAAAPAGDFPEVDTDRASEIDVERPSNFSIPDAARRDTLPTAGPFFDVTDIRIEGIDDRPDIGLEVDDLVAVAEQELARQANEQEIAEQGYSDEELLEVARYLDRVKGRRDDSEFTKLALVDELIELLDDFEDRRGINVFNLGEVAQRVEDRIRGTGLILAQVVVPPQTVREGSVTLRVYPGQMGSVEVAENEVVKAKPLEGAFADVVGKPVLVSEIDERLRLANDLGGVDLTGVFVPGRSPGETKLRLNTVNEKRWLLSQRVDNHGTSITGRTRYLASATIFDLTGAGDELALTGLKSEGPDPVTLLNASYYRPLWGLRNFVQAGISKNEFTISGAADIQGDTTNYDIALGTYWLRSRDRNLNQTVHVAYKDSELTLAGGANDRSQKVGEFGTTMNFDALIEPWRAVIDGSTTLTIGSITSGRFEGTPQPNGIGTFDGQDENFVIASQRLRFFKLFDVDWPVLGRSSQHSILISMNGQFTEQFLPAVNRIALGGADGVRSLIADDISVDKGMTARAQVYWQLPTDRPLPAMFNQTWSEAIRPFVFYDYGYGVTKASQLDAANQDDTWFEFTGYGIGFEYNLFKDPRGDFDIRGSVSWAWPSTSRFGDPLFETVIDDEDRIYADFSVEIDQTDWPFWGGRKNR